MGTVNHPSGRAATSDELFARIALNLASQGRISAWIESAFVDAWEAGSGRPHLLGKSSGRQMIEWTIGEHEVLELVERK